MENAVKQVASVKELEVGLTSLDFRKVLEFCETVMFWNEEENKSEEK